MFDDDGAETRDIDAGECLQHRRDPVLRVEIAQLADQPQLLAREDQFAERQGLGQRLAVVARNTA